MSISVLEDDHGAVMYCNTTKWAFGPVFESADEAWDFRDYLDDDPREYSNADLESAYVEWTRTRGLDFDGDAEREAFVDWLSGDLGDYPTMDLEVIHNEWKATVWGEGR